MSRSQEDLLWTHTCPSLGDLVGLVGPVDRENTYHSLSNSRPTRDAAVWNIRWRHIIHRNCSINRISGILKI